MTNKEALQALLDGKKIRKPNWNKDHYLSYNVKTDTITDEDGNYREFHCNNTNWELYEEPLLTEGEKQFVSKIADAMDYPYECIGFMVIEGYIVVRANEEDRFAISLKDLAYKFEGLECSKEYSLEELGINGND
jgi:hypothetical protein